MERTRVTVIDDDQDVLDILIELLEEYGFDVDGRTEPISRIEELAETRPDLMIIDLRLDPEREELTGLQTIHAARSSPALQQIPIIVCTADVFGLRAAWPALMDRGDIHQLTKPFDLRTFERVIAMALGTTPRRARSREAGMVGAEPPESQREA